MDESVSLDERVNSAKSCLLLLILMSDLYSGMTANDLQLSVAKPLRESKPAVMHVRACS
jgi:hypothetical protein